MMLDFASQADYFWALLPEIVLSLAAMLVLLVDVFQKGNKSRPSSAALPWVALGGIAAAAVANGWLLQVEEVGTAGVIAVDSFRVFTNFTLLGIAAFSILISIGYLDQHRMNLGEYFVLLMFSTVGMMVMAGTRDLILLFLALELMSVAVYVLVGFNRRDPRSAEGALKYFLLGAFSSAFLLYGVALVFGSTGSTNMTVIRPLVSAGAAGESLMLLIGAGLLLVGLGFKTAAVPFHMWTPDAYDGAPTPVTAFMATGVKLAAFAAFIRVFVLGFAGIYYQWAEVFWWLAVLTMVVANLIALTQGSVKRMLAYSSIAHAGYLLVALVSANRIGTAAFLFYLVVYSLMTIGAFGIVIANERGDKERASLDDYAGLGWQQPLIGALFTVFLISLAGFPLTGGFIGKLFILRGAVDSGLIVLAVILVLTSLLSYFYYLRVVIVMYMRPAASPDAHAGMQLSMPAKVALTAAAVAVLVLFLYPGPLLDAAQQSVASFFPLPNRVIGRP